jgi:hypothetical protein
LAFVEWWGRRLQTQCVSDIKNNLFTDQRWCDLAPCFLERLYILKKPGYNVAYWNLAHRSVTRDAQGDWSVNGEPLVFFHFSGVSPDRPEMVSKHQDRFTWKMISSCQLLFTSYLNALRSSGWAESSQFPYAYAHVGSIKLCGMVRKLYRENYSLPIDSGRRDLQDLVSHLCTEPAEYVPKFANITVTRLMYLVYALRSDLRLTFFLGSEDGQRAFVDWFEVAGESEYGFPLKWVSQDYLDGKSQPIKKKQLTYIFNAVTALEYALVRFARIFPSKMRKRAGFLWGNFRKLIYQNFSRF